MAGQSLNGREGLIISSNEFCKIAADIRHLFSLKNALKSKAL